MFAKGPRFPAEKPSEAPGPGHYRIPGEFRHEAYKKGAFLEKADRFGINKGTDVPGPGTYNSAQSDSHSHTGPHKARSSPQELIHLQQQVEALKTQNAKLQREHQQAIRKREDKIVHNESTIKSLVKDNVAMHGQVSAHQRELRSVSQREMALRAALEKAEAMPRREADRASKLAGLQQKLQDFEKHHVEEKKKHQAQVDLLKYDLDGSRKAAAEQSERLSMLQKQTDVSESRMKDLKKTIIADQAETKELRTKLRDADQAKTRANSRQGELDQLKRALQCLEAKHKAELHEKESKADAEVKQLEVELSATKRSAEEAKSAASRLEEERLHIEHLRATMACVAEEYGRLAASSVPLSAHRQIQLQCASLQLRNIRLERRLADRELLVEQLTDYCRQASEEKMLLASLLQEAEEDQRALLRDCTALERDTDFLDTSFILALLDAREDFGHQHTAVIQGDHQVAKTLICFYQAAFEDILVSYAVADRESIKQSEVATLLLDVTSHQQAELGAQRLNCRTAEVEISAKNAQLTEAVSREQALQEQLAGHKSNAENLEEGLGQERESNRRLTQAAHQSKKNEELLRLEVEGLMEDLADATRFKEAHADLLGEVVELIQRNELAEAEAERLSKFNAEILGHTNPQQKIFYVDRIRRELADTKHRLLQSTRNRDELFADNAALHHEVSVYKSVTVPIDHKPRRNRVRIERTPLSSRSVNGLADNMAFEITPPEEELVDTSPMTLEEIM